HPAARISVPAITAIIAGASLAVLTIGLFIFNPSFLANRWFRAKAVRVIGQRADAIVNPAAADAHFVEIVPRAHWGRAMLETAVDVGFARVDPARATLLFEGDRERYSIPAASIQVARVETCAVGEGLPNPTAYSAIVLLVRTSEGLREIPMVPRMYRWRATN